MNEVQKVIALKVASRARVRTFKPSKSQRTPARVYPAPVVPMFADRAKLRERSQAGLGITIALGFSAICWAGLAALIL